MKVQVKMKTLCLALLTSSAASKAQTGFHGMVLFGDKHLYAAHMPMFNPVHNSQVLLEVQLEPGTALDEYKNTKDSGQSLFTLAPEVFNLKELKEGHLQGFSANLYAGHFEKDGILLGEVSVQVKKVVFQKIIGDQAQMEANDDYLIFGKNGEYYAIHKIFEEPSHQMITSVDQPKWSFQKPCMRRYCPPVEDKPLGDDALPTTVKWHGGLKAPIPGSYLGWFSGVKATVSSVIFFEELGGGTL